MSIARLMQMGASGVPSTAYTLSNVSHVTTELIASGATIWDVAFKPDGLRAIFLFGFGNADNRLREYTLSSPWSLSTLSFVAETSIDRNFSAGLSLNDDGSKLYIADANLDNIVSYDLPNAYSLSGITNLNSGDPLNEPRGLHYVEVSGVPNIYYINFSLDRVERASMTGGDVNNITSISNFSLSQTVPRGITLSPDGTIMLITDNSTDAVYQYNLSTEFDITTASYSGLSFDVSAQEPGPAGVVYGDNGRKMILVGFEHAVEYNLV